MSDPTSFDSINDARSSKEAAQWWLLFAVMVAGKNAEQTEFKLRDLLDRFRHVYPDTPFGRIAAACHTEVIGIVLRSVRVGQYRRIEAAFRYLVQNEWGDDPRDWPVSALEQIPGVGPKTARWFRLLVAPNERVAALDTHVLKFLCDCGYPDVPKSTPPAGLRYARLEQAFLDKCDQLGMGPRDLDFFVWSVYRNGGRVTFLPLEERP